MIMQMWTHIEDMHYASAAVLYLQASNLQCTCAKTELNISIIQHRASVFTRRCRGRSTLDIKSMCRPGDALYIYIVFNIWGMHSCINSKRCIFLLFLSLALLLAFGSSNGAILSLCHQLLCHQRPHLFEPSPRCVF